MRSASTSCTSCYIIIIIIIIISDSICIWQCFQDFELVTARDKGHPLYGVQIFTRSPDTFRFFPDSLCFLVHGVQMIIICSSYNTIETSCLLITKANKIYWPGGPREANKLFWIIFLYWSPKSKYKKWNTIQFSRYSRF